MQKKKEKIAVILLNLGGPEKLADVRPFLYNLFSDRQIIKLGPFFLQKPIAWWIAKTRAPKSREFYRQIGGGSPLNKITAQQCQALEDELNQDGDFKAESSSLPSQTKLMPLRYKVFMAMRYWQPYAKEILAKIEAAGITKIVALTLYPHYSIATTGSSLTDLQATAKGMKADFDIIEVSDWPDEKHYINCLAERIISDLNDSQKKTAVVYSAHSLPVKFIEGGDPYVDHLKRTIQAVEVKTKVEGHLCFQSRSGPVEWLAPSTPEMIDRLATEGYERILMVPISFVSDHVETLCEIDIQYRELIEKRGMLFKRTESLNIDPEFIQSLAGLVRQKL